MAFQRPAAIAIVLTSREFCACGHILDQEGQRVDATIAAEVGFDHNRRGQHRETVTVDDVVARFADHAVVAKAAGQRVGGFAANHLDAGFKFSDIFGTERKCYVS